MADFSFSVAEPGALPLAAEPAEMRRFLDLIFAETARTHDEGLVELSWDLTNPNPKTGKWSINRSKLFQFDQFDQLTAKAESLARLGSRTYIGAAVKRPDTPRDERTKKEHVWVAAAIPADFDDPGAAEAAAKLCKHAPPSVIVQTGSVPHVRQQFWWILVEALDDAATFEGLMRRIASALGADPLPNGCQTLMRLNGGIAWPRKEGRVPELVRIVSETGRTYSVEDLEAAFPDSGTGDVFSAHCDSPSAARERFRGDDGRVVDGREKFMTDIVYGALMDFAGEHGRWPNKGELFALAWKRYEAEVDLSKEGRDHDELTGKIRAALAKARKDGFGTLKDIHARWHDSRIGRASAEKLAAASRDDEEYEAALAGMASPEADADDGPWWRKSLPVTARGVIKKLPAYWMQAEYEKGWRNGLWYFSISPGKADAPPEFSRVWICDPFEIVGRMRGPDGEDWARVLHWRDGDGRNQEMPVSNKMLHGDPATLCGMLASGDLTIGLNGRKRLVEFLNMDKTRTRITQVHKTGWHDLPFGKIFALPDRVIGPDDAEPVRVTGVTKGAFASAGTLTDWQAGVGTLVRGHSRAMLAVCAALAGPLLILAGQDSFGLNVFGKSSSGKSTLLRVGVSVWRSGRKLRTWSSTANGLEAAASHSSDGVLELDEIGAGDAKAVANSIYGLMSGTSKGRANRDAGLREAKSWQMVVLSSGEQKMADKIAEDKGRKAFAGQQIRLLDIPADAGRDCGVFDHAGGTGNPADLALEIRQVASLHYGTAGPAFVHAIIRMGADLAGDAVRDAVRAFVKRKVPRGSDGQVERVAAQFGLVAAAGEMAIKADVLPWQAGEANAAAEQLFDDWFIARGGKGATEVRDAIAQVRAFIEKHGSTRFEKSEPETKVYDDGRSYEREIKPVLNRAGYFCEAKGEWWILPEQWRQEVCAGLDQTFVAKTLADAAYLIPDQKGKQFSARRTVSLGQERAQVRVYVITKDIFDGVDDQAAMPKTDQPASQRLTQSGGTSHGTKEETRGFKRAKTDKTDQTADFGEGGESDAEIAAYAGPFASDFVAFERAPDPRIQSFRDHGDWQQAVKDARAFLQQWGEEAARLGWTARDLFGLHPNAPEPLSRYDAQGIIWSVKGLEVTSISDKGVMVEGLSGPTFISRPQPIRATVF